MEFRDYVRIVLAHRVGVIVLALAGLAGAYAYNVTQPEVYQANATGLVTAGKTDNTSDASLGDQLAKSRGHVVRRDRHQQRRGSGRGRQRRPPGARPAHVGGRPDRRHHGQPADRTPS